MSIFPEQTLFNNWGMTGSYNRQDKNTEQFSRYRFAKTIQENNEFVSETSLLSSSIAGVTTSAYVADSTKYMAPLLHAGPPATFWGMTAIKGAFTENVMQRALISGAFEATSWSSVTPHRIGNQGIDGLFFRTDHNGNLRNLMVAEAKYGSSELGKTKTGLQMSRKWTSPRLQNTANNYEKLATKLQKDGAQYTKLQPPKCAKTTNVPWKDGKTIQVWHEGDKIVYNDPKVTPIELAQQAKRTALTLNAAASGKIEYRSTLVHVDVIDGKWVFEVQRLDPNTAMAIGKPSRIEFTQNMKSMTQQSMENVLVENGWSKEDAKAIAKKCIKDPEYFKQMSYEPRMYWKIGLSWQAVGVAAIAGAIVFLLGIGLSCLSTGNVDWEIATSSALMTFGGTFAGQYLGSQISSALIVTDIGKRLTSLLPLRALGYTRLAGSLGGFAGGLFTSALISYGLWLLGLCDIRTAHRSMVAGSVGTAGGLVVYISSQAAVVAWGTASTGTAISELGGAAAAKATMAWFGGGSIASGGLGASVGTAILSSGVLAVAVVAYIGVNFIFKYLDKNERLRLINGRLEIVFKRISQGTQPEWI